MYLSNDTMEKYSKGYQRASVVLSDYINKSRPIKEVLAEKAGNDPLQGIEELVSENLKFYRLKHINKDIRKGLVFSTTRKKSDFVLMGYITLFGKEYENILGCLYHDKSGLKYAIPEPSKREFFM